jgi:hypothetical protein
MGKKTIKDLPPELYRGITKYLDKPRFTKKMQKTYKRRVANINALTENLILHSNMDPKKIERLQQRPPPIIPKRFQTYELNARDRMLHNIIHKNKSKFI